VVFLDTQKIVEYIPLIAIFVHRRHFSHTYLYSSEDQAVRGEFVELSHSHGSVLLTSRCPLDVEGLEFRTWEEAFRPRKVRQ